MVGLRRCGQTESDDGEVVSYNLEQIAVLLYKTDRSGRPRPFYFTETALIPIGKLNSHRKSCLRMVSGAIGGKFECLFFCWYLLSISS